MITIVQEYVKGDSFFTCINKVPKQYNYLTEDIKTDVIIVGGGSTGAILGYYFTKNNIDTVILEKSRIAHGSTSISTSLLQYELDSSLGELLEYTTKENIIKTYKLGLKAIDEIEDFVRTHGNKCEYKRLDSLYYATKKLDIKLIENEYNVRKEAGFPVKYIAGTENPYCFDMQAGLLSLSGGARFDPYKYTHSLLEVAEKKGLRIYENTEVIQVNHEDDGVEVITLYENKVKGKILIVATGYDTKLFTDMNFGVTFSTSFNIATKPIINLDEIYANIIGKDTNDPYHYFRTTEDNRLIFGGSDISFQPDINNEKLCKEQYDKLETLLKQMFSDYNIEIEYRYAGAFAATNDNVGFIGKDPKRQNIWYCLGYGSNGILFSVLGGMMLSQMYTGTNPEGIELFKVNRYCK